jgi:exocyst complex component 2
MPISAERERELLNAYKLTSLYPTEWPHQHDESSEEEDEDISKLSRQKSMQTANTRFQNIARHASLRSSVSNNKLAQNHAGVQSDESDALGMAPSVAGELRKRGVPVEEDLALRNKFMLSSTSFSPALYLSQVHQSASTEDLLRGLDFLSKSIEQKSASLKVLVESNFERFVRAKAIIDTVYTEMRTQGVEPTRISQLPAASSTAKPHSRQTSKNQSHFRNTSGAFAPAAKSTAVDKKKNALTKESEYGVQGIKVPLQEVAIKAEEVWGPALGGREKEETLKSLMSALDQHRDIFKLSGTMYEAIKKNDYDSVVDAYKQAKSHAEKARKIVAIAKENDMELGDEDVHQIIVTARMWHDVTVQVNAYKVEIWRRLKTSHGRKAAPVAEESDRELHMDIIAVLLQLGVEESPIFVWIDSRYHYLRDRIARSFERGRIEIEILRRRLASNTRTDNAALAKHLRSACTSTGTLRLARETIRDLDTDIVLAFWDKVQACLTALLSTQTGILAEVLEWWEISQSFIENRAQKSFPTGVFATGFTHLELDPKHVDAIRMAALELVTILRESITSFFQDSPVEDISELYSPIPPTPISPHPDTPSLQPAMRSFSFDHSSVPSLSATQRGDAWEKFAFWPPGANSLSGAHYLARLSALVGTAMGELAGMSIIKQSNETEKLKAGLVGVRERCITAICASWNADAEKCRVLESWTRSPERRDLTLMPAYFEAWEEKVLTNVQKIAYISEATVRKSGGSAVDVIVPPSAKLLQAVRGCFVTSLYKGLSGMVENAEKLRTSDNGAVGEDVDPDGVTVARKREIDGEGPGVLATEAVDVSNRVRPHDLLAHSTTLTPYFQNVRMLITLSNLNHLRSEVIPQLISLFESCFSVKLTEESKTIRDVLSQIDARLFQSYVKSTVDFITSTITSGINSPAWEPADSSRPTDARPYIYDVLISLVMVHAEVTASTTSGLTNQILSYLLEQSSLSLIAAFKTKTHYSLSALMQATLDVEFLAQTLNNYTTDRAGEVQSQIYLALDERTDNDARSKLQGELPAMRGILKGLREKTKGEFGCFRRERRGRREAGSAQGGSKTSTG